MKKIYLFLFINILTIKFAAADYCTNDPGSSAIYCAQSVVLVSDHVVINSPYIKLESETEDSKAWYAESNLKTTQYFRIRKKEASELCENMNFGKQLRRSLKLKEMLTTIIGVGGYIKKGVFRVVHQMKCEFEK